MPETKKSNPFSVFSFQFSYSDFYTSLLCSKVTPLEEQLEEVKTKIPSRIAMKGFLSYKNL